MSNEETWPSRGWPLDGAASEWILDLRVPSFGPLHLGMPRFEVEALLELRKRRTRSTGSPPRIKLKLSFLDPDLFFVDANEESEGDHEDSIQKIRLVQESERANQSPAQQVEVSPKPNPNEEPLEDLYLDWSELKGGEDRKGQSFSFQFHPLGFYIAQRNCTARFHSEEVLPLLFYTQSSFSESSPCRGMLAGWQEHFDWISPAQSITSPRAATSAATSSAMTGIA